MYVCILFVQKLLLGSKLQNVSAEFCNEAIEPLDSYFKSC
jgi:hypothetical protein